MASTSQGSCSAANRCDDGTGGSLLSDKRENDSHNDGDDDRDKNREMDKVETIARRRKKRKTKADFLRQAKKSANLRTRYPPTYIGML